MPELTPDAIGAAWLALEQDGRLPSSGALLDHLLTAGHDISKAQVIHRLREFCGGNISDYRRDYEDGGEEAETPERPEHQLLLDGEIAFSSSDPLITTAEQLYAAARIDLSYWEPERVVPNSWQVAMKLADSVVHVQQLYQVKAWLCRREVKPFEEALRSLVDEMREAAPAVVRPHKPADGPGYLLVVQIPDTHINKRALDEAWTVARAAAMFRAAGERLAARVMGMGIPVKRIVFLTGNDGLHADNFAGTTTSGTWLDTAGHQERAVRAIVTAYLHVIGVLSEIAPVDVVPVGGNHDEYSSMLLAFVLEGWYHRTPTVTVDTSAAPRKYYRFGNTLLGFYHGAQVKPAQLPLVMMTEARADMAATTHWEWLLGHLHKRAGLYYPATEEHGVMVRFSPALCPPDKWHEYMGFVGNKQAAEALLYHEEHGPAMQFQVFIDELADTAAPLRAVA